MKQKNLFHGSNKKIAGSYLIPKRAIDLGDIKENILKAVYATDNKNLAIAMAIIKCKGVGGSSLNFYKKPYGTIYEGNPKQKYIYLYSFPAQLFKQSIENKRQWVSFKPIKYIKLEKLIVSDYLNLVKIATREEAKRWFKKYAPQIKKVKEDNK